MINFYGAEADIVDIVEVWGFYDVVTGIIEVVERELASQSLCFKPVQDTMFSYHHSCSRSKPCHMEKVVSMLWVSWMSEEYAVCVLLLCGALK